MTVVAYAEDMPFEAFTEALRKPESCQTADIGQDFYMLHIGAWEERTLFHVFNEIRKLAMMKGYDYGSVGTEVVPSLHL